VACADVGPHRACARDLEILMCDRLDIAAEPSARNVDEATRAGAGRYTVASVALSLDTVSAGAARQPGGSA
jgi:hypothetical protein